jgi:hypothetical protein
MVGRCWGILCRVLRAVCGGSLSLFIQVGGTLDRGLARPVVVVSQQPSDVVGLDLFVSQFFIDLHAADLNQDGARSVRGEF